MSIKRDYRSGVPVLVGFQWVCRLDFFRQHDELVKHFLQLVARWAVEADVRVYGYAVRTNHAHLILSQGIDGHDRRRRKGIAAMMRNVLSQLAVHANEALSGEGRAIKRTYSSHNLRRMKDFLQALSYVHHQDEHHQAEDACCEDSRHVYWDLEMDGVVTAVPLIPELAPDGTQEEQIEALAALLDQIGDEAIEIEEFARQAEAGDVELALQDRVDCSRPWSAAVNRLGRIIPIDLCLPSTDARPHSFVGSDAYEARKAQRLARPRPRYLREDRPAPRIGSLIRITVVRL